MTDTTKLPRDTTFVVWAARHRGTRSAWLAAELGIEDLHYLAPSSGRGLRAAPMKYPSQLVRTLRLLTARRPRAVFVQSPPSFAGWTAAAYAAASGAAVVVDAHSDAFERAIWTRPAWVNRQMAQRIAAVLVTDEHWARIVRSWGGTPILVPNVPAPLVPGSAPPLDPERPNVAVVNTWAPDEPLDAVLAAAELMPGVAFHVTGRSDRVGTLGRPIPAHVTFTGFLDEATYLGLLATADAVVCLTSRDHTMQNGAAEALTLGTPVVTSDWAILRSYFSRGTVHTDNSASSIEAGLRRLLAERDAYRAEIVALRDERRRSWEETRAEVIEAVWRRLAPSPTKHDTKGLIPR
ncbi:MAG: glycosyltransferase [Chloroflexota bacterium]